MNRIYFVTCRQVGMVKIGLSADPAARLMEMQKHSPLPLVLEAAFAQPEGVRKQSRECAERRLHERHAPAHSHAEWFRLTDAIEADIDAARSGDFDANALPIATLLSWSSARQGSAAA